MSFYQYSAILSHISTWALLICGITSTNPWAVSACFLGAFLQMLVHCYWHYKATEEFT